MPKIGEAGAPTPGRKKGQLNRTTALLKEAIVQAAELAGEDGKGKNKTVGYLKRLAIEHPPAFATLLGKVLPLQINGGEDEDGLPKAIEIRYVSANAHSVLTDYRPPLDIQYVPDRH